MSKITMQAITGLLGILLATSLCATNTQGVSMEKKPKQTYYGRPVVKYPAEGATRGTKFDDLKKISSSVFNIRSIAITSGDQVDSIQVTYILKSGALHKTPKHGGGSGRPSTITLAADGYVAKVEGSTDGIVIKQLIITTKRPNQQQTTVHGPFGKTAGNHNFTLTENFILGFQGRASDHLNSIGIYCLAPVELSDNFGWYNIEFKEHPDDKFPPAVKISKILVGHGMVVDSVQFQYQLHGGGKRLGDKHGGDGGNLTTIHLNPNEQLVGTEGLLAQGTFTDLKQVTFTTHKKNSLVRVHHGPFGNLGDTPRSIQGYIVGCAGSSHNNVLDSIALYYY